MPLTSCKLPGFLLWPKPPDTVSHTLHRCVSSLGKLMRFSRPWYEAKGCLGRKKLCVCVCVCAGDQTQSFLCTRHALSPPATPPAWKGPQESSDQPLCSLASHSPLTPASEHAGGSWGRSLCSSGQAGAPCTALDAELSWGPVLGCCCRVRRPTSPLQRGCFSVSVDYFCAQVTSI